MNCREALEHLYDYLDNELNESTVRKVKAHLSTCEHCFDTYEFEKILHAFVAEKGKLNVDAEPLKMKVMERIAEIDASSGRSGLFHRFRPYFAAVAAVIVTAVGLYTLLDRRDNTLYAADIQPFLTCHQKCILEMTSGTNEVMTLDQIDSCFAEVVKLPEEFLVSSPDRDAVIGMVEKIGDRDYGHMMFKYGGNNISVYVLSKNRFIVPKGLELVKDENHEYHLGSLEQFNVLLWQCKNIWCLAVSDLDVNDMMTFASSY